MARATWVFWLAHTPLNAAVVGGNGLIGQLTLASNRQLSFNLTDADTFTFSMPLRAPQTALVQVMATDVLAICNDRIVQRFRVKSRRRSKQGDTATADFAAVAYRAVLGSWIVHDQPADYVGALPKNTLDWPASLASSSRAPSAVMWTIASEGQATSGGHAIGMTRGVHPTGETAVVLDATNGGTDATQHYLQPGQPRSEAIDLVAGQDPGYEWSIDPDPAAPLTALSFNVWRAGKRTQFTGSGVDSRSSLVLQSGATIADWSEDEDPSTWANVARVSGTDVSAVDTAGAEATAWRPTGQRPNLVDYGDGAGARWPVEGAVERAVTSARTTPEAIARTADREAAIALDYVPEYSVTLTGGRWPGVDALWVGDTTRVVIPDVQLSSFLRVSSVDLALDSSGTETVSMRVGRASRTGYRHFRRDLERRLRTLERGTR